MDFGILKNIGIPFLYAVGAYLGIEHEKFSILMIFIVLDSFLGTFASISIGEKWNGKKMVSGVIGKIAVLFIPVVIALSAKVLGFDAKVLVNMSIGVLAMNEAISILQNIGTVRSGVRGKERHDLVSPFLSYIIKFFQDKVLKILEVGKDNKS